MPMHPRPMAETSSGPSFRRGMDGGSGGRKFVVMENVLLRVQVGRRGQESYGSLGPMPTGNRVSGVTQSQARLELGGNLVQPPTARPMDRGATSSEPARAQ